MELSYTVDYDKSYRTQQYLLKNSKYGKEYIQITTLLLLWAICFGLLVPLAIISMHFGHCLVMSLYIIILLFMMLLKFLCLQLLFWLSKKALRKEQKRINSI